MAKKEAAAPKTLKKAKAAAAAGETCYGCGATSTDGNLHPVIGVLNAADFDDSTSVVENPSGESGEDGQNYVGVPVCDACWRNPEHRSLHPLKVHFFERKGNSAKIGIMLAGSYGIQG